MSAPDREGLTAVVLAAGLGTRFLPLTRTVPKPAIPFLNRPILHGVFDGLRASGVERVILNLHHLAGGVRTCAESHGGGLGVEYSFEPEILGTAGLYNPIRDILPETFLAANADIRFDGDLSFLLDDLDAHPRALASLAVLPYPEGASYTGLDVAGDGTLVGFGRGAWMFTGLYAARRGLLDGLPREGFMDLVKDLLIPALEGGKVRALPLRGAWADLGTPGEYLRETAAALERMAAGAGPPVPEGSRLENRRDFPVLIHRTAVLRDGARVVGPLVLGPNSEVEDGVDLGNAVLLAGARAVRGEKRHHTILGPDGAVCPVR